MPQTEINTTNLRSAPRINFHLPILAALALLILLYLAPVLPPFASGVRLGSDIANQYLPSLFLLRTSLRHGCIPLWNPYSFSGTPLIANMQRSALFYPATLLYCLVPVESAVAWVEAAHLFLAAAGMYGLLYFYTKNRWAGLFAAVGWTFGGFFANRLLMGHLPQLEACAYLPTLMLILERMLLAPRVSRGSILLGFVGALCVFAGYPESLFMIAVVLVLRFAAELLWRLRARSGDAPHAATLLANGMIALAVAGGLSAIQLLPVMELIGLSARVHSTYAVAHARSMPPMNLLTLALPDFLGGIARRDAVQGAPIGEMSAYAGTATLLLALAAPLLRTLRDRPTRLYAGLALFALLLSLGGNTPLYHLVFALPGFRQVAAPMRWVYVLAFALPVLAGLSVHTLLDLRALQRERLRRAVALTLAAAALGLLASLAYLLLQSRIEHHYAALIAARYPGDAQRRLDKLPDFCHEQLTGLCAFAGLAALTAGLLLWRQRTLTARSGRGFALLFVALLAVDLAGFDDKNIAAIPSMPPTMLAGGDFGALLHPLLGDEPYRVLPLPDADAYPDQNLLLGIPSAIGYDPIELLTYRETMDAWEGTSDDQIDARAPLLKNWKSPLAERWGVRYLITRTLLSDPGVRLVDHIGDVWVYRKQQADPRAYVVHSVMTQTSDETTYKLLQTGNGGFAKGRAFVDAEQTDATELKYGPAERVKAFRQPDPNHLTIDAVSHGGGLLVVADTYYPGWKATVDGNDVPVVPINGAMRGVYLGDGAHRIEIRYECSPLRIGAWVSGATLLLALLGLGALRVIRRRLRYSESITSSEISKLA